jgi:hypothetical protein
MWWYILIPTNEFVGYGRGFWGNLESSFCLGHGATTAGATGLKAKD